ncbi:UDP-N-acetylmuramate dehydrogenase [Capnocytophaga catalasegens]|uniref:UDP-N-acetylenolpyruvoylglucosamine reductase n=1 Tax=Capnocytophaga catalasegens TaxID=1004260 RepID=A0AAV5AYG1_9FLAO|nr:UDP-N-acetylmuramate dehydrogenase [Capnocytophaga catalasegens]GIZ16141.1 UDP-N-acetylenolpyruvoylglucosamine reductase [Capnocytophaga catalasegens]GJM50915.1 UDP-N-acetylenolpyruvoylglucosamine reductase [Capnocytophaga catalasegens]GJM53759.1 UDP-N-acetylenolpyruvoylglucosamine reductase [Capnocytophaga catalasegens]
MKIQTHISLKPYNTFGVNTMASKFIEVFSIEELSEILQKYDKIFVLGGGSNLLLTQDITIPVVKINLRGITIDKQDDDFVWITAQAGENWHQFVMYCISQGYGGVENLSLIPGNVGTTPVQNIGAYGVEIKDVLYSCRAMSVTDQHLRDFTAEECQFGYRESVFKKALKGQYVIVSVTFKLTKRNHVLRTSYGAIGQYLANKGIEQPTIQSISEAVIAIRQSKLPDPKELGNSGSFFKNPIIDIATFNRLKEKYTTMPQYSVSDSEVKVPAGWLIEACGLKGYRQGDAGVHKEQALVLVNYGKATGKEIFDLAKYVQQQVLDTFGIRLEMEVNVV